MAKIKQQRLSVSINADLVQYAREKAIKDEVPVSWIVARAIRAMQRQELSNAMIEGILEDEADPEYRKERDSWLGINGG